MGNTFGTRSSDPPILRSSLVIAGAIKSGKSSLANLLAEQLRLPIASFGDEVRRRAVAEGLNESERCALQELGERIVYEQPEEFVRSVIASARPHRVPGQPIVLDGLRHVNVLRALREILSDTGIIVIYLDASLSVRETRALAHSISADALERADRHRGESQRMLLRDAADIVLRGDDDFRIVAAKLIARFTAY